MIFFSFPKFAHTIPLPGILSPLWLFKIHYSPKNPKVLPLDTPGALFPANSGTPGPHPFLPSYFFLIDFLSIPVIPSHFIV